jgi:lysozyme
MKISKVACLTFLLMISILYGANSVGAEKTSSFLKNALEAENDFPFTANTYAIDISNWQPNVDWTQAINSHFHDRALAAVFIKATEGTGFTSSSYYKDSAAASSFGQITLKGAYHFYRTGYSGQAQAEHMIAVLNKDPHFNKDKDFYIIDVETNDGISQQSFADNLNAFITTMENSGFHKAMIYSGAYFWNSNVGNAGAGIWKRAKLWLPNWGANNGEIPSGESHYTTLPIGATKASIWQFTSVGHVNGISGNVDLDLIRIDF